MPSFWPSAIPYFLWEPSSTLLPLPFPFFQSLPFSPLGFTKTPSLRLFPAKSLLLFSVQKKSQIGPTLICSSSNLQTLTAPDLSSNRVPAVGVFSSTFKFPAKDPILLRFYSNSKWATAAVESRVLFGGGAIEFDV